MKDTNSICRLNPGSAVLEAPCYTRLLCILKLSAACTRASGHAGCGCHPVLTVRVQSPLVPHLSGHMHTELHKASRLLLSSSRMTSCACQYRVGEVHEHTDGMLSLTPVPQERVLSKHKQQASDAQLTPARSFTTQQAAGSRCTTYASRSMMWSRGQMKGRPN